MNTDNVLAIRQRVWDVGFRPVPIVSHDTNGPSPGKRPLGKDWITDARRDPPFCVTSPPVAHAMNTGLLAEGLRPIDVDVDDPALVARIHALATEMLGEAPWRTRSNSPRILILYRAWEGEPGKRSIAGEHGKVEILGRGQQFVAYGTHASGATLEWPEGGPGDFSDTQLPMAREDEIDAFLAAVAPVIGAAPEAVRPMAGSGEAGAYTSALGQRTTTLSAAAALAQISNQGAPADWERWNRVGMALWAATGGSEGGREIWHAWSAQHAAYNSAETNARWDHYFDSPPTQIGAGTLFHLAGEAAPGWKPPHHLGAPPVEDVEEGADDLYLDMESLGEIKPIKWVVKDIVEADALALIYGGPGSCKSFLAIDLGSCVASGMPWRGTHPVRQGKVIYIAGEGHNGLHRRFTAWKMHHQVIALAAGSMWKSASAMQTLDPKSVQAHSDRIAKICGNDPPVLVIIDTLARNYGPGDENSTKDMTAFVTAVDLWFRQRFGCAVLVIHHSGHNMDRARGSSSLKAAVDAEYEVVKSEEGLVTFTTTKMKDAEPAPPKSFELLSVDLGAVDDDGVPITSAVLVDASQQAQQQDVLHTVLATDSKGHGITVRWALSRLHSQWMSERELADAADCSKQKAAKILDELHKRGYIQPAERKGYVTLPGCVTPEGIQVLRQDAAWSILETKRAKDKSSAEGQENEG